MAEDPKVPPAEAQQSDVPTQVFQSFLAVLEKEGVPQEVVQRLKKTLIEDRKFSDKQLKDALFPEEAGA